MDDASDSKLPVIAKIDGGPDDGLRRKRQGLLLIREAQAVNQRQQAWILDAVTFAREAGASWQEVADALGTIAQEAELRYG